MPYTSESTINIPQRPIRCDECGFYTSPLEETCVHCGAMLADPALALDLPHTTILERRPLSVPSVSPADTHFPDHMLLILQVLPSAVCLTVQLRQPTVLGRGADSGDEHLISLAEFNALHHGVSRRHCRFERADDQLLVVDLGSTNGTYLNDRRLLSSEDYVVAHGDRLILGTLHLTLAFSVITA